MKKISFPRMFALNAYWLGVSFMWSALHPLILPAVLLNYVPETQKNTYLGLLTFVGLVIAMIIQPLSGALSDSWVSRWGRRRPLIVIGTLFDFVFLSVLAWGGGFVWLIVGYIGLQFSSNIAHGPAQGLLPDRVPLGQMGAASGLKTFLDMTALIIASLAAGRLLDPEGKNPTLVMLVVMGVLAAGLAVTVFGTPEEPTHGRPKTDWRGLRDSFRIDLRANTAYWWLIGQRFLFLIGIYGLQAFAQYYMRDVLRVENPVKQTGDLLAGLTLGLVVLALAGGWLSDRFGAKRVLSIAGWLAAVGFILLMLARTPETLVAYGVVIGAGIGLFLTANWALASRLAPAGEAGKFLGLTNLATAGSGALARLEGPLVDMLNHAFPGVWAGYKFLFIFGALCALGSVLLLKRVVLPDADPDVTVVFVEYPAETE
ncbi:MAG: SLC45 family MFS transporter [Chloroflexi bacterium]|nr:SLC45 family MFS transporter [Chloroflexota bacterium]